MSVRIKTNEFDKILSNKTNKTNKTNKYNIQYPVFYERDKPWLKTTVYKCINIDNFPKNSLIVIEKKLDNGDYSGCIVLNIGENLYNETNLIKCIEIDIFRETLRKQIEIYDTDATVIPYDTIR